MSTRVNTVCKVKRTLREGSVGRDVVSLQNSLRQIGFDYCELDGIYGFHTKTAVEQLQRMCGIKRDGIAGRKTRHLLCSKKDALRFAVYVVEKGDTLSSIAKRLGTSVDALARVNRISRHRPLYEGQRLYSISRCLLYFNCGLQTAVNGMFCIQPDGSIESLGQADLQGHNIPVFKITDDLKYLASIRAIAESSKQIRLVLNQLKASSVVVMLPSVGGALSQRLVVFLRQLRNELGPSRQIFACVPATNGRTVVDPRPLGRYADFLIIMAWRQFRPDDPASHLAPLPEIRKILKYVIDRFEPWRVILGISGSAIQYNCADESWSYVPYTTVGRFLDAYRTRGDWDANACCYSFSIKKRQVDYRYYYEDSSSVKLKANLADRLNLCGVAVFDASGSDSKIPEEVSNVYKLWSFSGSSPQINLE